MVFVLIINVLLLFSCSMTAFHSILWLPIIVYLVLSKLHHSILWLANMVYLIWSILDDWLLSNDCPTKGISFWLNFPMKIDYHWSILDTGCFLMTVPPRLSLWLKYPMKIFHLWSILDDWRLSNDCPTQGISFWLNSPMKIDYHWSIVDDWLLSNDCPTKDY